MHADVPKPGVELARRLSHLPPLLRIPPTLASAIAESYVGDLPVAHPYAWPGSMRLDGLPPTMVVIDDLDDLRPSGELLVSDLRAAGAPCREELVPGVPHGHLNLPGLPAALDTLATMAGFLNQQT